MKRESVMSVQRIGCCKAESARPAKQTGFAASRAASASLGFTLLELLASMAILAILMTLLFAAFSQASRGWMQAESRVETFTQARAALDYMSRELGQAIVNQRISFLAISNSLAFVAPVGNSSIDGLDLEEIVYRLSSDAAFSPPNIDNSGFFTETNAPYRLIRRVSAYNYNAPDCQYYFASTFNPCPDPWDFYTSVNWPETSDRSRTAVLAENIISLQFTFLTTNGVAYAYWNSTQNCPDPPTPCVGAAIGSYRPWQTEILDSFPSGIGYDDWNIPPLVSRGALHMTNHAPAAVQITIGAVDSKTAAKLNTLAAGSAPWRAITNDATRFFTTFVTIPNR